MMNFIRVSAVVVLLFIGGLFQSVSATPPIHNNFTQRRVTPPVTNFNRNFVNNNRLSNFNNRTNFHQAFEAIRFNNFNNFNNNPYVQAALKQQGQRFYLNQGSIFPLSGTTGQINYPFSSAFSGYYNPFGYYYSPFAYPYAYGGYTPYASYGYGGYGGGSYGGGSYGGGSYGGSNGYSPYMSYGSAGDAYQPATTSSNSYYNPYAGVADNSGYGSKTKAKPDPALAALGIPNTDGQVKWPLAFRLMDQGGKDLLQKLEGQLSIVAGQSASGNANPRMLDAANQSLDQLQKWLGDHQARMADGTFREGQNFLRKIEQALKGIEG